MHTGAACLEWAGDRRAPFRAAQGNMLVSEQTLAALTESFESAPAGPVAPRLLGALAAGQAAGGDRRGQQAAALLVVKRGGGYSEADALVNLRVDDHAEPVRELERLLSLHELYFGSTPAEEWLELGDELRAEVRERLDRLGYTGDELAADFDTWAGIKNIEERVDGVERLDPVVLRELRRQEER